MDIVKWLRELRMLAGNADWNATIVNNRLDEAANEIERLREDLDLIKKMARAEIDAKLRYAAALLKIADIEHEDIAAPKSAAETVLWVCLDRCVTLAENALKWEE